MRRSLIPNPPRPYLFPIQSILQPVLIPTPYSEYAQFRSENHTHIQQSSQYHQTSSLNVKKEPRFQDWKGSSTQDHATNRASRNDITDPAVEGVARGKEERKENIGIADATKSGATTERDLGKNSKRAKEENPKAPEPIIGMSDERGHVSTSFFLSFLPFVLIADSFNAL